MSLVALIPARGGSKRLPGKNTRPLGGKPLIAWTIQAALASQCFSSVLVSTDDAAIADISLQYGAKLPGLRPAHLATDEAGSVDVALHALANWVENSAEIDGMVLLQPTSPFRTAASIRAGCALFQASPGFPVVGVSPAETHPAWCFRIESGHLQAFMPRDKEISRSQDLPPAFAVNGAFYAISPARLARERSFLPADTHAFIMDDPRETLDIDTPWDWEIAECILARQPSSHPLT